MKYLTRLSFQGALWLGLLRLVIKAFSFIKLIVVARILSPHDLGLFGMILLPYGLAEVATESGINQALVQTRKSPQKYFSSAWLAFIFRGLALFGLIYFLAEPVSHFYNQDLILPMRLIALTPLIKGFVNPAVILFRRQLKFKSEFAYQSAASVVESLATIFLVISLRSLVALPLGVVAGGLAALALSFLVTGFRWVKPSVVKVIELYRYGKWVTVGTLINYLNDQGDDFLVSKLLGAQPLGLYQTAYKISNLPTTQGAGLIYQVVFPIFSSIQTDKTRLKRGLGKALTATFLLSSLFALVVYLTAPLLIPVFLGRVWLPMLPALNVLLLFGVSRPLISVGAAIFDALGQPKTVAVMNTIKLIVLAILVFPLSWRFGLVGTAWSVVISQLAVYPWFIVKLRQTFG